MSTAESILNQLQTDGIQLVITPEGRLRAHPHRPSADMIDVIRRHRDSIIARLRLREEDPQKDESAAVSAARQERSRRRNFVENFERRAGSLVVSLSSENSDIFRYLRYCLQGDAHNRRVVDACLDALAGRLQKDAKLDPGRISIPRIDVAFVVNELMTLADHLRELQLDMVVAELRRLVNFARAMMYPELHGR
jgi:hypothetical protein